MLIPDCKLVINFAGWTCNATRPVFNKRGVFACAQEVLGDTSCVFFT